MIRISGPTGTRELNNPEMIAGYTVHPFASRFPLMVGQAFDDLVASIGDMGIDVPVELNEGLVTDGRNRLRAVEVLRERGIDVEVPTVEWQPRAGHVVEMHIFARNVLRRHLTDDQRAMLATELLPIIRAASAARQAATRFGAVNEISAPPDDGVEKLSRTNSDRVACSTLGQLAKAARVGEHKMRQAITLADDIAAGLVPEDERDAVIRGDKPLRRAGRNQSRRPAKKNNKKPITRAPVDALFEDMAAAEAAPAVTKEEIRRRWELFLLPYPITEHREVIRLVEEILAGYRQADTSE